MPGASSHEAAALKAMGFHLETAASEVGGLLTFGNKQSEDLLQNRLAKADPKWQRLYASCTPLHQKQMTLYMVMWPTALHGLGAVKLKSVYARLRTRAVKALRQ